MINFILCDDEIVIINKVKEIITKAVFKTNVDYKIHIFHNYDDSFYKIMNSYIENKIYILDIEVGSKSGIEIAKEIRNDDWNSIILILTSHYELESLAYKSKILLLDFISKFDLYDKTMNKTIRTCINKIISSDKLCIRVDRKLAQIDYKSILYITYDIYKRKSIIITQNKSFETSDTLKNIKSKLKGHFLYTHKSCIVNMNNIKEIDYKNKRIVFNNDKEIDLISRTYIKEIKQYVNN